MATRPDIIQMVMIKMDELTPYSGGLVLSSTEPLKPIETTIDAILNECMKDLLLSHPIGRLIGVSGTPAIASQSDGSAIITLPSDYLRLINFQISGYSRPITEVLPVTDPRYAFQFYPYTKGNKYKPIALRETEGTIHSFSLIPGETNVLSAFRYIPFVLPDNCTQDELLEGLSWLTAGKALTALGHVEEGQKAIDLFTAFNQRP